MLSNEIPKIADMSGALTSRFIVLRLTNSFVGHEDLGLLTALQRELPGILNLSLEGLHRLRKRGHFLQPKSARAEIELLTALSSPVLAFLSDECERIEGTEVACDELYHAWKQWCFRSGREHPTSTQTFARDLHAAIPGLRIRQRRKGRERKRYYLGLTLRAGAARNGTR